MDVRPPLNKNISITDFREFYWLKEELITFCRQEGLKTSGGKLDISERIVSYLVTGQPTTASPKVKTKNLSKFDWNTEDLSTKTLITDNYKNTENVRTFFEGQLGPQFKFNVKFMNWMKANSGKNLEQAILQWQQINEEKKNRTTPKEIAPQFEYNRYLRDFLNDNPNKSRDLGIQLWKIKRSMRGDNVYNKADLKLLDQDPTTQPT